MINVCHVRKSPANTLNQNIEDGIENFPHIDFTLATTGFRFWNHVTHQFILYMGQITGVCFTHVALLLLSIIYSQLIPRELFYNLTDFSNTLLDPEMVKDVLLVMQALADTGITMAIVTHEMGFAREVASRIMFLDQDTLAEDTTPGEFFQNPQCDRAQQFLEKML